MERTAHELQWHYLSDMGSRWYDGAIRNCLSTGSGIRSESFSKQCFLAGVLCVVYGLGTAVYYIAQLVSPDMSSLHGIFYEEYRNSRVAPPLPFTMEYSFYDENNDSRVFYLDVLSKKEIIPERFLEDKEYIIYYEASTNIIIGVEPQP